MLSPFSKKHVRCKFRKSPAPRRLMVELLEDRTVLSPVITTAMLPTGFASQAYDTTIGLSGATAPVTWSVTSGSLPAGLSLDTNTGAITGTPSTANFSRLANFTNGSIAGLIGTLIQDSSGNLFGTTTWGGAYGDGTVFKVAAGTNALTTLVNFNTTNGRTPYGGLMLDGAGKLFGTTTWGGAYGYGTVFEVEAGTNALTTLVSFNNANGANPWASLVEDNSGNLFGTTYGGGAYGDGTVFEVAAGSNSLTTLVSFNNTNGSTPLAGLVRDSAGNLFGTTSGGGAYGYGTVFEIAAGTNTLTILVSFNNSNGGGPHARLVRDSSGNLFGTTVGGGANGYGTVFKVAAGTNALTTLVSFNNANGANPWAGLVEDSNGNLFGTTQTGGVNGKGTVFELAAGTNALTTLISFNGANGVGVDSGLVMDGNGNLFGTTMGGGADNDGTMFKVTSETNTLTTLVSFYGGNSGSGPRGGLIEDANGNLFGTTVSGGYFGYGTVYEVPAGTGTPITLVSFGEDMNGYIPYCRLIMDSSGNLFGTTHAGGAYGGGTVFEVAAGTNTLTTLASFNQNTGGDGPYAGLVMDSNGNLFGTAEGGGPGGHGTVFEVAAGTNTITTLVNFNYANGSGPYGGLVEDSSGNLFGTTETGGPSGRGTVFKIAAGTNSLTTLFAFDGGANGGNPYGTLIEDTSGNLFGTTENGGAYSHGTVFKVATGTNVLSTLTSLTSIDGNPYGGLVEDASGNLFGTADISGVTDGGTVFKVAAGTNTLTTLYTFSSANNDGLYDSLIEDSGGNLFGTTRGGAFGYGSVFEMTSATFTIQATDAMGSSASQSYHLTIDATPSITTTTLPDGNVNQPYNQSIVATGGTDPITWTVSAGSLPPGLILNSQTGAVTGTPSTTSGSPFSFTVTATDSLGATATQEFTITIIPFLTSVTGLSPSIGPTTGGAVVTVYGAGFTGATAVEFGSTDATSFTVTSDTQITAIDPAGTGVVDVTVTTPLGGTSANSAADLFTYVAPPTVTSLSPTTGPVSGGTSVVITGTGFTGATAVHFGATNATSFTVTSDTQITATSPAGGGIVDVTVTIPGGGTSSTSSADQFTYFGAVVTGVSPNTGNVAGGTVVTITGTAFTEATAVDFGTINATSYTVNSDTQITATSPSGNGSVDVTVTTSVGGTSANSNADLFTYSAFVTSSTANAADSSTTITINGGGFSTTAANNTVAFSQGVVGSVTSATTTQLTVTISTPPNALGSLTAVVTVNGFSTGAPVQVATEVAGTWIVTSSSASGGTLVAPTLPYAVTHALNGDQITFASSLSGSTITLTSTLMISHNVTITGLGAANLAVSGGGSVQDFFIDTGVTASITGMTLKNAYCASYTSGNNYNNGAAVVNKGTLSLADSVLTNNSAAYGGAGVLTDGALTLNNDTFTLNYANISGGALNIYTGGSATVTDCTFYGNSSGAYGGAIYAIGSLTMTDSTVAGNTAASNGGGLYHSAGTVTTDNTIFGGNTAGTGPDVYGTLNSANYCLISNTTNTTISSGANNHLNVSAGLASSLANNGGTTQTLALLPGSVAIGAGDPGQAGTTSQNAAIRPAAPDIGAFQHLAATTTTLIDNGPNPSNYGDAVSFIATVSGGSAISGETVYIEDADNANAVVASPTLSDGTVTFTISDLTVGTHDLFAVYNGDATNAGSNSSATPVTQVVNNATSAPEFESIEVNGGDPQYLDQNGLNVSLAGQNSIVEQILVTFNEPVTLDPGAFSVVADISVTVNSGPNPNTVAPALNAPTQVGDGHQWIITFGNSGGTTSNGNGYYVIKDGLYSVHIDHTKVHANSQTMAADVGGPGASAFWALYGDTTFQDISGVDHPGYVGDGYSDASVGNADFQGFKACYNSDSTNYYAPPSYNVKFDANLDGSTANSDFVQFKENYNTDWQF
jgi:uncharacterized repeat protein (TIGR03803 family)